MSGLLVLQPLCVSVGGKVGVRTALPLQFTIMLLARLMQAPEATQWLRVSQLQLILFHIANRKLPNVLSLAHTSDTI